MTATALRARIVLQEARALGLDLADLVAAADHDLRIPTLAEHVASVELTFTPATAATYRPYWRLAVALYGDRRVSDLGITELHAVVEAAAQRAGATDPAPPVSPPVKRASPPCGRCIGVPWTRASSRPTQRLRSPSPAGRGPGDVPSTTTS